MLNQYGFYRVDQTEILEVGNGKSEFTDINYQEWGHVGVSFSYGGGLGVGVKTKRDGESVADLKAKWLIVFESEESIDSLIETLERAKQELMNQKANNNG